MTSLASILPEVFDHIIVFICRLDVEECSQVSQTETVTIRRLTFHCFENSLIKFMLVSKRFVSSLTPPQRPEHVRNDQRQWLHLPPDHVSIEEVD